jgi:sulfhydrogenase subunit beta (sulfur reductase)
MTRSTAVDTRVLAKAKLPSFLLALRDKLGYRVVAPQRVGPADVVFDQIGPAGTVAWDYVNSLLPPKAFFFPRREDLFTIHGARPPTLTPPADEPPLAIFGMRSCDATGVAFLEQFFAGRSFDDTTVTERIRRSLRMTLACATPGPDCFCVCCEGGPFLIQGFDLQFVDLGEELLVETGTPQGESVVTREAALFGPAGAGHREARDRTVARVDTLFQRRNYVAGGMKRISLDHIPVETWEEVAESCRGCGGCCFVCPTCSCFTVADLPATADSCRRERSWDACLYAGFTREASGHNPRAARGSRLKRRYFHKVSYQYVERMGRHGCVGCGRCVTTCMGGVDIANLLQRFQDAR